MRTEHQLKNRTIVITGEGNDICIIQPLERRELALIQNELDTINKISERASYLFVGLMITDWNGELSPWEAPPVFGNKAFRGKATETLHFIEQDLLPYLKQHYNQKDTTRFILGGYSLAGLFSLWASTKTDTFSDIVAASPSVWFPQWDEYATQHSIKAKNVYLSLGDTEAITKNQVMANCGTCIEHLYQLLQTQIGQENCFMEWNKGGHFQFPEIRMGKGFGKILNKIVNENNLK